jgi:hypothetical protein
MLLPVTVQGDRQRSLALVEHHLPRLVIGDQVTGTVRVANTGTTFAAGWLEADVVNALTGSHVDNIQVRDRTRVAPGLSRTFTYTWHAGVTAGKFAVPVRVSYNRADAIVADVTVTEEVWLVHPFVLVGIGATLTVGLLGALAWRFRRRASMTVSPVSPVAPLA